MQFTLHTIQSHLQGQVSFTTLWGYAMPTTFHLIHKVFHSLGLRNIPFRSFSLILFVLSCALQYHNEWRIQIHVTCFGFEVWDLDNTSRIYVLATRLLVSTPRECDLVQTRNTTLRNDIQLSWKLEVSHRTSRGESNFFHNSQDLCITPSLKALCFLLSELNSREAGHSWVKHTF